MEFIEQSFDSLVKHLMSNGLEAKVDSFKLIDSLSTTINSKKINAFLLGVLINREKTPKNKIYREGREYKAGENFFEIYFAITPSTLDDYATILRILCDFEEDQEKSRYRLLNSSKELKEATLVEHFLTLKDDKGLSMSANAVFVRVERSVITLQSLPTTVPVRDVQTTIKRKK